MKAYATPAPEINALLSLVPPPGPWSLVQRLAIVRDGNPNFRRGRWSRWRARTEHQLVSWSRQAPRLVGMLRATVERHPERVELLALAEALETITPRALGAIEDTRPGRTPSKWRTRWYVPAAAMPAVRAWIAACRWTERYLHRVLGFARSWLRGLVERARAARVVVARLPKEVTSPDPAGRTERQTSVEPGSWEETAARMAWRFEADVGEPAPPTTT